MYSAAAPTMPAAGIVKIQAHTIRVARPQRMPRIFVTEPTPTIAPVMVWVVDTGTFSAVAPNRVTAPDRFAQNPPIGFSDVMPMPIVLMMRWPPISVPNAMALYDARITQYGPCGAVVGRTPPATITAQITPIVFCASLPPWPIELAADENSWPM